MDIEEALRWVDNNCYDEATVQRLRSRRVARTLSDEIERLRAEVEALRNRLNALVAELKAKSDAGGHFSIPGFYCVDDDYFLGLQHVAESLEAVLRGEQPAITATESPCPSTPAKTRS